MRRCHIVLNLACRGRCVCESMHVVLGGPQEDRRGEKGCWLILRYPRRFVTRLVDPSRHNLYGRSMYKIAQELGLPASMVDIRHEATHGPPPSLVVLRRKAKEALQWLWEHYWMKIG